MGSIKILFYYSVDIALALSVLCAGPEMNGSEAEVWLRCRVTDTAGEKCFSLTLNVQHYDSLLPPWGGARRTHTRTHQMALLLLLLLLLSAIGSANEALTIFWLY